MKQLDMAQEIIHVCVRLEAMDPNHASAGRSISLSASWADFPEPEGPAISA